MFDVLPIEIIFAIVDHVKYWKDIRSLRACCKRLNNIITKRADVLFEKRLISNDFVEYDALNQINKKNEIIVISEDLKFNELPWKYQTNEKCFQRIHASLSRTYVLKYINRDNLTKEVCAFFIKDDKMAEIFVDRMKQTEESCLFAVEKCGYLLKFVKKQTHDICLKAVKQSGFAFEFVEDQTEEICMSALRYSHYPLEHVKNKTPQICSYAVNCCGMALKYISKQNPELCLKAVQRCGLALEFVSEQTEEICIQAVKNYGCALKFVENQTEKICVTAIQNDIKALIYVKEQTELITYIASMRKDPYFRNYYMQF